MNKFLRNVGFYLLIILVAISIIDYFSTKNTTKQEIEYTQFLQQVDNGEVSKVVIIQNTIRGKLSDGTEFTTITPDAPNNDPQLYQKLSSKNVEIAAENPPQRISQRESIVEKRSGIRDKQDCFLYHSVLSPNPLVSPGSRYS